MRNNFCIKCKINMSWHGLMFSFYTMQFNENNYRKTYRTNDLNLERNKDKRFHLRDRRKQSNCVFLLKIHDSFFSVYVCVLQNALWNERNLINRLGDVHKLTHLSRVAQHQRMKFSSFSRPTVFHHIP